MESLDIEEEGEENEIVEVWCGSFYYMNECEAACGEGSAGACQWRPYRDSQLRSKEYGTCSPNLTTCPDQICDELEMTFQSVCPQDCAGEGGICAWKREGGRICACGDL